MHVLVWLTPPQTTKSRHCYCPAFQRWQWRVSDLSENTQHWQDSFQTLPFSRPQFICLSKKKVGPKEHLPLCRLFHSVAKFCFHRHKHPGKVTYNLHRLESARYHSYHCPPCPTLLELLRINQTLINTDPLFLQFLNIVSVLSKLTEINPNDRGNKEKKFMFTYILFPCNKIIQAFPHLHGWVYNMGKWFEIKTNFILFPQC